MDDKKMLPSIKKTMEQIASEICDHYCKWPDQFNGADEDLETEALVEQHCMMCPLVQFLTE